MRDKFSELINANVSNFEYINTVSDNRDPLCVLYNNLYSLFTDTHMAPYEDGYIITGHLRGDDYSKQISTCQGGMLKGYYNIADFFRQHNLCGKYSQVNGDRAYVLKYGQSPEDSTHPCSCPVNLPTAYYEGLSNIPKPIAEITVNYDKLKVLECYDESKSLNEVVDKLNKSLYVRGNHWFNYDGVVYGIVNNKIIRF